jgi:hypothetical protein
MTGEVGEGLAARRERGASVNPENYNVLSGRDSLLLDACSSIRCFFCLFLCQATVARVFLETSWRVFDRHSFARNNVERSSALTHFVGLMIIVDRLMDSS